MENLPDWRQAGLTAETLYDPDKALPFWLQVPPWALLRHLIHELRNEIGIVRTLMTAVRGDPNLAAIHIAKLGNMTALEAGDLALEKVDRILKILAIADNCEQEQRAEG